MSEPIDFTLPDGWTVEPVRKEVVALRMPADEGGGWVTVDFKVRNYTLGHAWHVPAPEKVAFGGAGWRQKLVDCAVAELRGVYE